MVASTDILIMEVIRALEGDEEAEIVRHLLNLRNALAQPEARDQLTREAESARARVINVVNNFFYERLIALPTIKEYMEEVQTHKGSS
jgi:acetolactate synthase small subunit